jgi:hypothetical protein
MAAVGWRVDAVTMTDSSREHQNCNAFSRLPPHPTLPHTHPHTNRGDIASGKLITESYEEELVRQGEMFLQNRRRHSCNTAKKREGSKP